MRPSVLVPADLRNDLSGAMTASWKPRLEGPRQRQVDGGVKGAASRWPTAHGAALFLKSATTRYCARRALLGVLAYWSASDG